MKKPFMYTHCLASVDGKIIGNSMRLPEEIAAAPFFKDRGYNGSVYPKGSLMMGTNSVEGDVVKGTIPAEDPSVVVPEGDFIACDDSDKYTVILDRKGRLPWSQNYFVYNATEYPLISVLTEKVSNTYKKYLRDLGISYVICGEEEIDFDILFEKLVDIFHIETLIVGGGGAMNWSMVRRGYADEVSIVIFPAADGNKDAVAYFSGDPNKDEDMPVAFNLLDCVVDKESESVWLRYSVKKIWTKEEFTETYGDGRGEFVTAEHR